MKKTAVFNRQLQPGPALHILLSFAVIININDQNWPDSWFITISLIAEFLQPSLGS